MIVSAAESGGMPPSVSDRASEQEGLYAWGWARNIWAEALA